MNTSPPLFELGRVVATPGALRLLAEVGRHPFELLARHVTGDPGDMDEEDKRANRAALQHGGRIVSSYRVGRTSQEADWKVWIITEADRHATTLLLPEEY
jgi:2,3-bisphosphoglycerate-independent phosphoglycerate mutase